MSFRDKHGYSADKLSTHIEDFTHKIGLMKKDMFFDKILRTEGGADRLHLDKSIIDKEKPFEKLFIKYGMKKSPDLLFEKKDEIMKKVKKRIVALNK